MTFERSEFVKSLKKINDFSYRAGSEDKCGSKTGCDGAEGQRREVQEVQASVEEDEMRVWTSRSHNPAVLHEPRAAPQLWSPTLR